MTAPEAPIVSGEVVVSDKVRSLMSPLITIGCFLMMGLCLYLLWKSDRRSEKSDAAFRDAVSTVKQRGEALTRDRKPADGETYSAIDCGSECAEGHTYRDGCKYHVTTDADGAEKM